MSDGGARKCAAKGRCEVKMPDFGYGVWRWGDVDPSGLAIDLDDAKKMLREGNIEGEVRDAKGNVVFRYEPKKPLPQRVEEAKLRLRRAEHALKNAEYDLRTRRAELDRLTALQESKAGTKTSDEGGMPLFAGKDGAK